MSKPSAAIRNRATFVGTLAAGAAATVASQQADASIIYTPLNAQVNAANPLVNIDFNQDAAPEVAVTYNATSGLALTKQSMSFPAYIAGTGPNAVKGLSAGDAIDSTAMYNPLSNVSFPPTNLDGTINDGAGNGEFTAAAGEKYIGLEFGGPGSGPFFGWIGFRVDDDSSLANLSGTVTGFAYETTGMGLAAGSTVPEPSSLGLLAMGATGLAAYRRRGR